jgi:hypothetical protein
VRTHVEASKVQPVLSWTAFMMVLKLTCFPSLSVWTPTAIWNDSEKPTGLGGWAGARVMDFGFDAPHIDAFGWAGAGAEARDGKASSAARSRFSRCCCPCFLDRPFDDEEPVGASSFKAGKGSGSPSANR